MSSIHLARQGFITKSALPNVTRERGTTTGSANLMLYGAGKTTVSNNITFVDSSANAFTVTRNGDTVQSGFNPFSGVSNGSGRFDGSGDYLSCASNAAFAFGSGDFTIEYWIYASSWSTTPTVVDTRTSGISSNGYSDFVTTGGVFSLYIGNTTVYTMTGSLPLNTWTHIAVSRSGTSLRVFINGTQNGSTVTNSTVMSDTNLLVAVNRGVSAGTIGTSFFNGYITNARIVNGTAVYTSNFTPPTSPLTAITNTSLLLLMDNYSIVNSTATNLPISIFGNTAISTAQFPTGMSSSIYFDGVGDYLTIPNGGLFQFGTGNFTIEWWQFQTVLNSFPRVFSIGNYPTAFGVSIESGNFYYWMNTSAAAIRSVTGVYNTWTHFAVSRSGGVTKLFRNGVQMGADVSDTNNISNSSTALSIGAETTPGAATYFTGYISNFRVVKGAALYTSNFTVPSAPLPLTVTVTNFVTNSIYGVYQLA